MSMKRPPNTEWLDEVSTRTCNFTYYHMIGPDPLFHDKKSLTEALAFGRVTKHTIYGVGAKGLAELYALCGLDHDTPSIQKCITTLRAHGYEVSKDGMSCP